MSYRSVGIIGAGVIGKNLFKYVRGLKGVDVAYILVTDKSKYAGNAELAPLLTDDAELALARKADLVVEAATPAVLKELGPHLLVDSDVCGFSCSALADQSFDAAMRTVAGERGHRFFVPHGAVLGLDGLRDGRDQIEKVVITTTKSGASLGQPADARGTLFDGSTRQACEQFPRNVNVHAAVAFAGIGFDRTRSIVVADPDTKAMRHHIAVSGQGLDWEISVTSQSLGGVTGSYTPASAMGSLRRIFGEDIFAIA
ncbi:aspartate dehydrogenase (plasmid) [Neorhizobium sp. NCHU2750]|nr:aspartate dehydrogenase [Neorhizobium sp. NCHU2750]